MAQADRPTTARSVPEEGTPVDKETVRSVTLLDPRSKVANRDSLFSDLVDGNWQNTQQHGRQVYDAMMRDTSVSAPYTLIKNILQSLNFEYHARTSSPTERQQEMADFLNAQLKRLGHKSTHRHGWSKFFNGLFGQGLKYGFALAEITTKIANWNDRPYVQIEEITALPQRSLDGGSLFSGEFVGSGSMNDLSTFQYDCFKFNSDGEITSYIQNRDTDSEVRWDGSEKRRILHYTHDTGDGNPFGQSLLWSAYYPWADKYVAERLEQWKLENADTFVTMSYDSETPLPEVHEQVVEQIEKSGDGVPILIAPRSDWSTVSVISPQYSEHIGQRKDELRTDIANGLLVPESLFTETDTGDVDSRNLIQVFFKFRVPALVQEISEVLTWQLGKRLIDANYSHIEPEDYPVARAQLRLDNDLRVTMPMLQQLLPYIDSERLGEFSEEMFPGMQKEWFPEDHDDSVHVQRQVGEHEEAPHSHDTSNQPPPKQPGETREETHGQTENANQVTDTMA